MKNLLFTILLAIPTIGFSAGAIEVTFTNQADFNAYNFLPNQSYWVILKNDTNLPQNQQINSLLPLENGYTNDTILLGLEHTLIENLDHLDAVNNLTLIMKGNKLFDTLYVADNIQAFSLICEHTYLRYIYGAFELKLMGTMTIYDNDHLKKVDLDLGKMDVAGSLPLKLRVEQNDSLKSFFWNNPHHQLSELSFFENRQLKHIHIETVTEKVYDGPLTGHGGFNFNVELDSITGFKGLKESSILQIRKNYKLKEVCVLQEATQLNITNNPNVESLYKIENNATGLQSLNDLLTADCSWLPNGVAELPHQELTLYPNPAHKEVFVEMPDKTTPYQIYDMSGKVVKQGNIETNGRIGLTAVSGGMYILLVGDKRSKLVIQ